MNYQLSHLSQIRLLLLATAVFCLSSAVASAIDYQLSGTISDPSDNLLPGVRVALKNAQVETQTDGNGEFTLSFTAEQELVKDQYGNYDKLDLDKEGFIGRTILIRNLSIFNQPLHETIEPNPIGEDNVGFSVRMSMDNVIPGYMRAEPDFALKPLEDWEAFFAAYETREPSGQLERATFHAYVPAGVEHLKAAFLISRHGMGTIDHPKLRSFADKHGIALVGILGDPVQRGIYPVDLLDEHLTTLGDMIGHPELATVPVFTFGHSNGTGFSGIIAAERPDRVIAWISYHSGASFHLQFPGSELVPCLAMHGNIDNFANNGQEQTIKNLRQERNAAVGLMMEAYVGHGPVDEGQNATWDFIIAYCEAAMRTRLNEDGSLRPVVIEDGWLGAHYDRAKGGMQALEIAPYAEFSGDQSTANWFPDELFARAWQRYGLVDPRKRSSTEWHVDNVLGNDANGDGSKQNPFKSIARALQSLQFADILYLTPNDIPYNERIAPDFGGSAGRPLIIDGRGAMIDRLTHYTADKWEPMGDGIWRMRLPNNAWFMDGHWTGFDLVYFNGEAGMNVTQLENLTPLSYFLYKNRTEGNSDPLQNMLYIRLPDGEGPDTVKVETCGIETTVYINRPYTVVRNLSVKHSTRDGFATGEIASDGVIFERINSSRNMERGISNHGAKVVVRDSHFYSNTGGGLIDADDSANIHYIGCLIENDLFRGGTEFFNGNFVVENSIIRNNRSSAMLVRQGASLTLRNSILIGNEDRTAGGLAINHGTAVEIENCTFYGFPVAISIGRMTEQVNIRNSAFLNCGKSYSWGARSLTDPALYISSDFNFHEPITQTANGVNYTAQHWSQFVSDTGLDTNSINHAYSGERIPYSLPELDGFGKNGALIGAKLNPTLLAGNILRDHLLVYAFALDGPAQSSPLTIIPADDGSNEIFLITRRPWGRDDLIYQLEGSDNLHDWETLLYGEDYQTELTTPDDDLTPREKIILNDPETYENYFYRLRVSLRP